ncbi:hypothetical protein Back2_20130 [Nocardioides baekrokdamisoli]|uniref:Immunity protein 35 domain-containing protein n=1 Tax=Nocardioides baekrokdamisoli TaxID=1804624 RepID=A0A3G9IHD0_9ACTN|nr:YrhB domain-containing protein [Nocardioides baekrokdamisoli]BBH17726.1 hypothetical protein Back2_20130 [Nocardioides baekrokdamisoli]
MDVDDARRIAEAELARWNRALTPNRLKDPHATSPDADDEVVVTDIETHSRAWILHFASRRWVRTRAFSDQLVGTCPLVVEKETGSLHKYGSGEYAEFSMWLDETTQ